MNIPEFLKINSAEESRRIEKFLKQTVSQTGFEKVIVAVSGGVDSATVLSLCVRALGKEKVLAVKMPYGEQEMTDADLVIRQVGIPEENRREIDIKPIVDNFKFSILNFKSISKSKISNLKQEEKLRLGNIMARVRMTVLFDLAKSRKALVCGTENKSEHLLGYYTRFGDEASDIEPIRHLYKTQIYQLAKYLGVPARILEKQPTAGLWQGQTDEGEMGFSYQEADEIFYWRFEKGMDWEEIGKIKNQKSKIKIKEKTLDKIKKYYEKNEFKQQLPILLK